MASTFYGISFNITGFGLNIYLTQFVYGAIELPAKLSAYYLLDKVGRRNTEVGSLLGAGICLAVNIFLPRGECFFCGGSGRRAIQVQETSYNLLKLSILPFL